MNDNDVLKELVQKAAAGDKTAFEKLYQETCRSVYFTCLNILKDEQEAQDLTQDVYLTALEKLSELEDAGKFKSWLYRIAANKSIKRLKKKKPLLLDDEQLEDAEAEENENFLPEEYALNAEKRALVLEITRKVCTEAQYRTILLYYFNELSVAEIAEIMECQESNVKKRLSIARAK
ncbi:MAG: sigma-70 family RNA polymerase sigma factor, partial [Lachnospiraceae bacterium]|nr:sigma-70 family RNA polymerase sigma factor [Lachnospiraceae bacterium]